VPDDARAAEDLFSDGSENEAFEAAPAMRAKDQQMVRKSFSLLSNLLCRFTRPHDDLYALAGRFQQWSGKSAYLLDLLVRISVDKHGNTPRYAFDRERLRGLIDVEQGQRRRVPLSES
jgi:hypothetical protein